MAIFIELQDVFTQQIHCVNTAHIVRISPYNQIVGESESDWHSDELNALTGAVVVLNDGLTITVFDRDAYVANYDMESLNFGTNVTATRNLGKYLNLEMLRNQSN